MRRVFPALPVLPVLAIASFLLAAGSAGCRKAQPSAPQTCSSPGPKKFGEACDGPCDCASGFCWKFGDGDRACTKRCTDSSECPPGSRGQKCTRQGVCRT
jgi:hypothetical protein